MTIGTFDCRSYDVQSYAWDILNSRIERFSTIYACCFITAAEAGLSDGVSIVPGEGQPAVDWLIAASSTGELRLYRLSDLAPKWPAGAAAAAVTTQSPSAACSGSWVAHEGSAYCLAKVRTGSDLLLLSGGDDGFVRGWRLRDIVRYLQAYSPCRDHHHQQQQPSCGPSSSAPFTSSAGLRSGPASCLAVRVPRAESPLAVSSLPPAVQTLALGDGGDTSAVVYVGCSDGGVHCLDLSSGALLGQCSGPGHVAAVLAMDSHSPSSCLATGSEDGTVRLWDTRLGSERGPVGRCARVLDAAAGQEVAGGGAKALRCLRNPPVTCLRFEPSGSWLLCGHGGGPAGGSGGGGRLSLWNIGMAQTSRQAVTGFVPQAVVVLPSEFLVVGSEASLSRYSLALEGPTKQPLAASSSAFALDVHPLTGAVVVGGVGASLELLSKYGKRTGGVTFVSDED